MDADGAGIGPRDEEYSNDDENDPEAVENVEDGSLPGNSGPRITRPHTRLQQPGWLTDEFERLVKDSKRRDSEGLPPLYQQGLFWFPTRAPFFILRKNSHVDPHELYRPRFFLWDPLCFNDISCPNCRRPLTRQQHIPAPRRVVDINSTFWMIGYRYRCHHCPLANGRSVTFRSWNCQIMDKLPTQLTTEFPACLSHRSGISKGLFEFMRSCFQNGIGSKQFADMLWVQHLLAYSNVKIQYLLHVESRRESMDRWSGQKFANFKPFEDTGPTGRHGYTPSSNWLRDMYDSFLETHQQEINQHMSMLSGDICAIDHSHKVNCRNVLLRNSSKQSINSKVTKHIARVNGEQVFTGLLTVTNSLSEIRICNFVATKSHSQFVDALSRMRESLTLYGHKQPIIFYTDNMNDKQLLESTFPSLHNNVIPIEKYAHLPALNIPDDVQVFVKSGVQSINDAVSTILSEVPEDGSELVIGFDSEWNVEIGPQGFVRSSGPTAIVQMAFKKRVYILQVRRLLLLRECKL